MAGDLRFKGKLRQLGFLIKVSVRVRRRVNRGLGLWVELGLGLLGY